MNQKPVARIWPRNSPVLCQTPVASIVTTGGVTAREACPLSMQIMIGKHVVWIQCDAHLFWINHHIHVKREPHRHQQVRRNHDINPNDISSFLQVSIAQVIKLSVIFSHSRVGNFMPVPVSFRLEIPICSAFSTEGHYLSIDSPISKKIRIWDKLELQGGNLAFFATAENGAQIVEFAKNVANVYRARQTTNDLSFAKTCQDVKICSQVPFETRLYQGYHFTTQF